MADSADNGQADVVLEIQPFMPGLFVDKLIGVTKSGEEVELARLLLKPLFTSPKQEQNILYVMTKTGEDASRRMLIALSGKTGSLRLKNVEKSVAPFFLSPGGERAGGKKKKKGRAAEPAVPENPESADAEVAAT